MWYLSKYIIYKTVFHIIETINGINSISVIHGSLPRAVILKQAVNYCLKLPEYQEISKSNYYLKLPEDHEIQGLILKR